MKGKWEFLTVPCLLFRFFSSSASCDSEGIEEELEPDEIPVQGIVYIAYIVNTMKDFRC